MVTQPRQPGTPTRFAGAQLDPHIQRDLARRNREAAQNRIPGRVRPPLGTFDPTLQHISLNTIDRDLSGLQEQGERLRQSYDEVSQRIERNEGRRQTGQATEVQKNALPLSLAGSGRAGAPEEDDQTAVLQELETDRQILLQIEREMERVNTRYQLADWIVNPDASPLWPIDEAGDSRTLVSTEDIVNVIQNQIGAQWDEADQEWLLNLIGESNEEIAQGQTDLEEFYLASEPGELVFLESLSVQETLRALTEGDRTLLTQEELAQGNIQLRGLTIEAGDQSQVAQIEEEARQAVELAKERQAQINAQRAGLESLEFPELSWGERLRATATSPLVGLGQLFEYYNHYWARPWAGAVLLETNRMRQSIPFGLGNLVTPPGITGLHKLLDFGTGLDELEAEYQRLENTGGNPWVNYGEAFDNWEKNWPTKLIVEVGLDPLSYVGTGVATKVVRPVPWVGKRLSKWNQGFTDLTDEVFRTAFTAPFKNFPRTIRQKAVISGAAVTRKLDGFLRHHLRIDYSLIRTPTGATRASEQFISLIDNIGAERTGTSGTDYEVLSMLIEASNQSYLSPQAIVKFSDAVGGNAIAQTDEITMTQLTDAQKWYQFAISHAQEEDMLRTATAKLIDSLAPNVAGSKRAAEIGEQELKNLITGLKDDLKSIVQPRGDENARDLVLRIGRLVTDSTDNFLRIPSRDLNIQKFFNYEFQGGAISSIMSGIDAGTRVVWTNGFEKQLWTPVARSVLTFGSYGFVNFIEGIVKPALEGITPYIPRGPVSKLRFIGRKASPLDLHLIETLGLRNSIDELTNFRGEFIEQAGFINREGAQDFGTVAEQILSARFLGRIPKIGKYIDLYHWAVRVWGDLAVLQRADAVRKIYRRQLQRQNPELAAVFESTLNKHLATKPTVDKELDNIFMDTFTSLLTVNADEARRAANIAASSAAEFRWAQAAEKLQVEDYLQDQIRTALRDPNSRIFNNPDGFFDDLIDLGIETKLREPTRMADRVEALFDQIDTVQPRDFQELVRKKSMVEDIMSMRESYIETMDEAAIDRAWNLPVSQRDRHYEQVQRGINLFKSRTATRINKVLDDIRQEAGLTPATPIREIKNKFGRTTISKGVNRRTVLNALRSMPVEMKVLLQDRPIKITTDNIPLVYKQLFDEYIDTLMEMVNLQPIARYLEATGRRDLSESLSAIATRTGTRKLTGRAYSRQLRESIESTHPELLDNLGNEFSQYAQTNIPASPGTVRMFHTTRAPEVDIVESLEPGLDGMIHFHTNSGPYKDWVMINDRQPLLEGQLNAKLDDLPTVTDPGDWVPIRMMRELQLKGVIDESDYNRIFSGYSDAEIDILRSTGANKFTSTHGVFGEIIDYYEGLALSRPRTDEEVEFFFAAARNLADGSGNVTGDWGVLEIDRLTYEYNLFRQSKDDVIDFLVSRGISGIKYRNQYEPGLVDDQLGYSVGLFDQNAIQTPDAASRYQAWNSVPVAYRDESYNQMREIWPKDRIILDGENLQAKRTAIQNVVQWLSERNNIWRQASDEHSAFVTRHFRTARGERDDTFWTKYRTESRRIWRTASQTSNALLENRGVETSGVLVDTVQPPLNLPDPNTPLSINDVSRLMGFTAEDTHQSVLENVNLFVNEDFWVSIVRGRAKMMGSANSVSAEAIENSWSAERLRAVHQQLRKQLILDHRLSSDDPFALLKQHVKMALDEFGSISRSRSYDASNIAALGQWSNEVVDDLASNPRVSQTGWNQAGADTPWHQTRETAMEQANQTYFQMFADYAHPNAINQFMRAIFPFWTFATHRWHYVPKELIRHPGMANTWAGYMDATKDGYIDLPGSDIFQSSFARGTIFNILVTTLNRRDYPSWQDHLPLLSETADGLGRFGFWSHPAINGVTSLIGPADPGRRPSFVGLAPPAVQTAIHGFQGLPGTQGINKWFDTVFPEPFRDFHVMTEMAHVIANNRDRYDPELISAVDVYFKVRNGDTLTPDERELWDNAFQQTARNLLFVNHTGMLRMRPEKLEAARDEARALIAEWTGITVEEQERLEKDGFRYNDFIRGHLTLEQQDQLNKLDLFLIWSGRSNPLMPSAKGREQAIASEMWDAWTKTIEQARSTGVRHPVTGEEIVEGLESIEAEFRRTGQIDRYNTKRREWIKALANFPDLLSAMDRYKDVPFTREQREAYWEETGLRPLQWSPEEELMFLVRELEPEDIERFNEDLGRFEAYTDFDTYFAQRTAFYELVREESPDIYAQIIAEEERNLTELEKAHRSFDRSFGTAYRGLDQLVMEQFSEAEQELIKTYRRASFAEQKAIEQAELADPADERKIISTYKTTLTGARKRFRVAQPDSEAWMLLFGTVTTPSTPEAVTSYLTLKRQFGIVETEADRQLVVTP